VIDTCNTADSATALQVWQNVCQQEIPTPVAVNYSTCIPTPSTTPTSIPSHTATATPTATPTPFLGGKITKLQFGLAVGLGVPFILLAITLFCCILKRCKRRRRPRRQSRFPMFDNLYGASAENLTQPQQVRPIFNRRMTLNSPSTITTFDMKSPSMRSPYGLPNSMSPPPPSPSIYSTHSMEPSLKIPSTAYAEAGRGSSDNSKAIIRQLNPLRPPPAYSQLRTESLGSIPRIESVDEKRGSQPPVYRTKALPVTPEHGPYEIGPGM
jgi:hypothetical protein